MSMPGFEVGLGLAIRKGLGWAGAEKPDTHLEERETTISRHWLPFRWSINSDAQPVTEKKKKEYEYIVPTISTSSPFTLFLLFVQSSFF